MPTSIEAITIIALALTPGYICLWFARQAIRQVSKQSEAEFLISTVAVGVVVNVLIFPLLGHRILRYYRNDTLLDHEWLVLLWGVITIFVVPVLLGLGIGRLINRFARYLGPIGLDPVGRIPHAWDFAMRRKQGYYVRVWLNDGQVVAGKYSIGSFASSDRERADLFLEEVWFVDEDGYFLAAIPNSAGVWIAPDCISRVEFTDVIGGINELNGQNLPEQTSPTDRG
jgi:hypothetical protein